MEDGKYFDNMASSLLLPPTDLQLLPIGRSGELTQTPRKRS